MKLPGKLRLTTLGDLLGALHRAGASGVLELTEDRGATHRIYLSQGMVTQIDTDLVRQRLGDVLAGQGFLGARALARLARRLLEAPCPRTGEILVEEGFVSTDLVRAGLRRQLRQKLDALFQLREAQISFRVPRPHEQPRTPLSPGEFLHGRPRARPRTRPQASHNEATASHRADPSWGSSSRSTGGVTAAGSRTRAYAMLGLLPGADRESIQQAFRRLARSLHPDRFPHADPNERARLMSRFAELSAAYHSLAG